MSAVIFGVPLNGIIPQPDFSASKSANGGWTASASYKMKRGAMDNATIRGLFPSGAKATDLDPNLESFFSFLKLVNVDDISNLEGGFVSIRINFAGLQGGESATVNADGSLNATFHLRGTARTAPLTDHPKWKSLDIKERHSLGKLLTGEWSYVEDPTSLGTYQIGVFTGEEAYSVRPPADQLTTDDAKAFAQRIAEGITSYEGSSFEWSKMWQSNIGIQAAQLNRMGKIDSAPGNPPEPGGGRNWMLVSADQVQNGDGDYLYTNQVNYLLSEPGGFDIFLQDD
jgi:hypothetical protein